MIVTRSNLDYLITPVRMRLGDVTGAVFTNSIILTGLVFGVKMLQSRWNSRYFVYTDSMHVQGTQISTPGGIYDIGYTPLENDVLRNPALTFVSQPPPIIDQTDEYAIVLAACILTRRSVISSSMTAFTNWATPDLSVSNVQSGKMLQSLIADDEKALDALFRQRLAHPQKSTFPVSVDTDLTPYVQDTRIIPILVITDSQL